MFLLKNDDKGKGYDAPEEEGLLHNHDLGGCSAHVRKRRRQENVGERFREEKYPLSCILAIASRLFGSRSSI